MEYKEEFELYNGVRLTKVDIHRYGILLVSKGCEAMDNEEFPEYDRPVVTVRSLHRAGNGFVYRVNDIVFANELCKRMFITCKQGFQYLLKDDLSILN